MALQKMLFFGDKFSFLIEEELEKAKQRRLRQQTQFDPSGLVGTLFEENGRSKL